MNSTRRPGVLTWYASSDGSGTAIDSADSREVLDQPLAAYRSLTTGPVQAPAAAYSARARIVLRPRAAGPATIYIDDVSFAPSAAPVQGEAPRSSVPAIGGGGAGTISQTSSMARAPGLSAAQPSPVLQRSEVLPAVVTPPDTGRDVPSWAWVLAGGVIAAVALASGTWWWESKGG